MFERRLSDSGLFINTIRGDKSGDTPIWFMRQAGRYLPEYLQVRDTTNSFLEFCYDYKKAAKVTLQPIERFDFDAAIIFSDILVIPDALGIKVDFVKNEGPVLERIKDNGDVSELVFFESKLDPVYEAISIVRSSLSSDKALIGFSGSPWTLATYMIEGGSSRDFLRTKMWSYQDCSGFQGIIDILVEVVSAHMVNQVKAGVDVLQLFDSWAGVLSEVQIMKWCIEPTRRIVENIRSVYPEIPIIGFPRSIGVFYKEYSELTGVDAISFDQGMSCEWICDNVGTVIQGNLDPVLLSVDKDAAVLQTKKILDTFRDRPFVFNLGHGILKHTPIENVEAVVRAVKEG